MILAFLESARGAGDHTSENYEALCAEEATPGSEAVAPQT